MRSHPNLNLRLSVTLCGLIFSGFLMNDPDWTHALPSLTPETRARLYADVPLASSTYLQVGGTADFFCKADHLDTLAELSAAAQRFSLPLLLLGEGTNALVSDRGVRGLVVINACCRAEFRGERVEVETGHNLMSLFVKSLERSLSGLEFAVGIPGTVGGALVSNAGAYRSNMDVLVREVEVVEGGERRRVSPEWMEFQYRDSRLRSGKREPAALLSAVLELASGNRRAIRMKAKDYQYQRILKQPWEPSAGSFFKNVLSQELAQTLPGLSEGMRKAGVVPAAFLSEACGLKGFRIGGAAVSPRHANFIVNRGGATASEIQAAALQVKRSVFERFGVTLEEEVMRLGDWPPEESTG